MSEDRLFEAHRYEGQIREVYLIGSTQEVMDISELLVRAELYEDLFSPTISGNMIVKNNKGILKDLKLNGADRLIIVISDEEEGTIPLEFLVYAHNYSGTTDTFELVGLNFVSMPHVLSLNTHLWNAYKGDISSIVKTVFNNLISNYSPLPVEGHTIQTPTVECDSTEGIIKIISPGWMPFQLISWLCGRATNAESGGSLFTFYQTIKDGYKFKCIENLINSGNTSDIEEGKCFYYGYSMDGYEKNNVKRVSFGRIGDTLKNYKELYNDLWMVDFTKKAITKRSFDAYTSIQPLLNAELVGTQASNNGFNFDFYELRNRSNLFPLKSYESTLTHNNIDFIKGNSLQRKNAILRQLNAVSVTFEAFNNIAVQVGEVIDFDMPLRKTTNESDNEKDIRDKELSGRYIVTSKALKYDLERVTMEVEAIKDSILED